MVLNTKQATNQTSPINCKYIKESNIQGKVVCSFDFQALNARRNFFNFFFGHIICPTRNGSEQCCVEGGLANPIRPRIAWNKNKQHKTDYFEKMSRKRTRTDEERKNNEVIDLVSPDEEADVDDEEADVHDEEGDVHDEESGMVMEIDNEGSVDENKEPDRNDRGKSNKPDPNDKVVTEKLKFGVLALVKDTEGGDETSAPLDYFELRALPNEQLMFSRLSGEKPLRRSCVADSQHFSISYCVIKLSRGEIRKRLLTNYALNGTHVRRMVGANVSDTYLTVGKSELLQDADIISVSDSHHVLEFMFFEKSPAGRKKQVSTTSASLQKRGHRLQGSSLAVFEQAQVYLNFFPLLRNRYEPDDQEAGQKSDPEEHSQSLAKIVLQRLTDERSGVYSFSELFPAEIYGEPILNCEDPYDVPWAGSLSQILVEQSACANEILRNQITQQFQNLSLRPMLTQKPQEYVEEAQEAPNVTEDQDMQVEDDSMQEDAILRFNAANPVVVRTPEVVRAAIRASSDVAVVPPTVVPPSTSGAAATANTTTITATTAVVQPLAVTPASVPPTVEGTVVVQPLALTSDVVPPTVVPPSTSGTAPAPPTATPERKKYQFYSAHDQQLYFSGRPLYYDPVAPLPPRPQFRLDVPLVPPTIPEFRLDVPPTIPEFRLNFPPTTSAQTPRPEVRLGAPPTTSAQAQHELMSSVPSTPMSRGTLTTMEPVELVLQARKSYTGRELVKTLHRVARANKLDQRSDFREYSAFLDCANMHVEADLNIRLLMNHVQKVHGLIHKDKRWAVGPNQTPGMKRHWRTELFRFLEEEKEIQKFGTVPMDFIYRHDEVFADTALSNKMYRVIDNHTTTTGEDGEAFHLFCGDGAANYGGTSYFGAVHRALRFGWTVHLWSWRKKLNEDWYDVQAQHPNHFFIHIIDDLEPSVGRCWATGPKRK